MNIFQEFTFEQILRIGIAIIIIFASLVAILYGVWGGFLMIISGGNEEKIKPAVNHIRHAIIGLLVLLFVVFFSPMALRFFGFPIADEISTDKIFETMKSLSDGFLGNSSLSDSLKSNSIDSSQALPDNFSDL